MTSNHPQHYLTNILFSLARRICTIENENVKRKHPKELKNTLLEQKYPKLLKEASTLAAKEIPPEILRQPKTAKMAKLFLSLLHTTPSTQTFFPIGKQSLDNF